VFGGGYFITQGKTKKEREKKRGKSKNGKETVERRENTERRKMGGGSKQGRTNAGRAGRPLPSCSHRKSLEGWSATDRKTVSNLKEEGYKKGDKRKEKKDLKLRFANKDKKKLKRHPYTQEKIEDPSSLKRRIV